MAWIWVLVAVIGVGLPAVAFCLGRNPRLRPLGAPGPHADPIDRWLFGQYRLGELDRTQVKSAVFVHGRRPDHAALQEAAHGLATEVIRGRFRTMRWRRWWLWSFAGLGVAIFANGVAEQFFVHHGGSGAFGIAEGAFFATVGVALSLWLPGQARRKALRVLGDSQESASSG